MHDNFWCLAHTQLVMLTRSNPACKVYLLFVGMDARKGCCIISRSCVRCSVKLTDYSTESVSSFT